MIEVVTGLFDDLLCQLNDRRRAHSREVGRKAASAAQLVPAWLRSDLVTAATLHDIGYAYRDTGFHALDGAYFLVAKGFSPIVCNLVVHHSASTVEAQVRGFDLSMYDSFEVEQDLRAAHQIIAWADMTTEPAGQTMTVEDRLDEICSRYGPEDLVTTFIGRARPVLLAAGQSPTGSIQV